MALAIAVAIALQVRLPEKLSFGPYWVMPAIEAALFLTLTVVNPSKLHRESRDLREVSIGLTAALSVANLSGLGLLLYQLLRAGGSQLPGRSLLLAAVSIWCNNVIAFGVWYWEIDRGGPIRRCQVDHAPPDFIFPQMENPGVSPTPWAPKFVDYLYISLTNSSAFSPTDTLPLTRRAKLLMGAQALISLATVVVVGARAVNILR